MQFQQFRLFRNFSILIFCMLATSCIALLIASKVVIAHAAKNKTYSEVSQVPYRHVGLVLGCPKRVFGGWSNPFFENRIASAADLYQQKKVSYLVVSGDNHIQGYDEPTDMKNALVEKGVPADRIYLDYAGFRTLDSVVRLKEVFGQTVVTIVSQKFHNQRAIFLAHHFGIDAIGFNAPEVALRYGFKTFCREQFAKVKAVLDVYLLHKQPHFLGDKILIGNPTSTLDAKRALELAELMCSQLPNVGTFVENREALDPKTMPIENRPAIDDRYYLPVSDDTDEALERLGPYSVPCLVNRLIDTKWMPDPRTEPLLGAPVVGDMAYMILGMKGVPDVLPSLANKKPNELRMNDYFIWPNIGDHRNQLQKAVRVWLADHPDCCGVTPILLKSAPTQPRFRMPEADLARTTMRFSHLKPGLSPSEVLSIAGKPDAIDGEEARTNETADSPSKNGQLLGFSSADHYENLAYIYFVERWAAEIANRDPLRDRYVILYFSGTGKLLRVFSNVSEIHPIFPKSAATWEHLMWGVPITGH